MAESQQLDYLMGNTHGKELACHLKERRVLEDVELDRKGILGRLNEAAIGAHLLGEFAKEATILMQIAKFQGFLKDPA